MSENLNTHFDSADAAHQKPPSREALMEDALKRILFQCQQHKDTFYFSTRPATRIVKIENADLAQRFFMKWFLSIDRSACTDHVNTWNFCEIANNITPLDYRWYNLERGGGMTFNDTRFTYMMNLDNALEIMTEKANSTNLELDGELLWGVITSAIEAGRTIIQHHKENLESPASDQTIMINTLKYISNTIDLFGGRFAGLDQKTITALKNEMLDPRPYDKDKMLNIVKSAKSNLSDQPVAPQKPGPKTLWRRW